MVASHVCFIIIFKILKTYKDNIPIIELPKGHFHKTVPYVTQNVPYVTAYLKDEQGTCAPTLCRVRYP